MKSKMPEISRISNRQKNTQHAVEKDCRMGVDCIRKMQCVMIMFFLSLACATDDLYKLENRPNKKELEVNPHGPLSKDRGTLHKECNHIELKQQLDPNVNWHYKLKIKKPKNPASSGYRIRWKTSQKKYTISQTINSKILSDSDYKKEYYAVLQQMFFNNRCVDILRMDTHHFYSILSKKENLKNSESYMLLASLFLLSEGLKLPISINMNEKGNTVVVLDEVNRLTNSTIFSIDLTPPTNGKEKKLADDKKKKIQEDKKKKDEKKKDEKKKNEKQKDEKQNPNDDKKQNSADNEKKAPLEMTKKSVHNIKACAERGLIEGCAECIITFFIKYCEKYNSEREGFAEPNTYNSYMTGEFMNMPGFLIQNYVHQYINDDADKRMLFVSSVRTLIEDCLPCEDSSSPKLAKFGQQARNIYNRCFVEKGALSSKEEITVKNIEDIIPMVNILTNPEKKKIPDKMVAKNAIEKIIENIQGDFFINFLLIDYATQELERYKRKDSNNNISFIKSEFEITNKSLPGTDDDIKRLVYIGYLLKKYGYIEVVCGLLVRAAYMDLDGKQTVTTIIKNLLRYRSFSAIEAQDYNRHLIILIDLLGQSKKYFSYDKLSSKFTIRFEDIGKETMAKLTASICSYLLKKESKDLLSSFINSYLQNWTRFDLPIISEVILKMPDLLDKKDLLFLLTENGKNIKFIKKIMDDIKKEHEKQNINKESTEPDIEKEHEKQNTNNRRNSLTKFSKNAIAIS